MIGQRGDEIQAWLRQAAVAIDGIVILDDAENMVHLSPWLVRTSVETGLTEEDAERAIGVLAKPAPDPSFEPPNVRAGDPRVRRSPWRCAMTTRRKIFVIGCGIRPRDAGPAAELGVIGSSRADRLTHGFSSPTSTSPTEPRR